LQALSYFWAGDLKKKAFDSFKERSHGTIEYSILYGHPEDSLSRKWYRVIRLELIKTIGKDEKPLVNHFWTVKEEADTPARIATRSAQGGLGWRLGGQPYRPDGLRLGAQGLLARVHRSHGQAQVPYIVSDYLSHSPHAVASSASIEGVPHRGYGVTA
jgi:hypothetical protein